MVNRSEILRKAWADYRRDVFKGWGVRRGEPFNRKHFAYCLRMVWAVAKEVAAKPTLAPASTPCTNPVRAAAIRPELRDMEFSGFINWPRHASLKAELVGLHA